MSLSNEELRRALRSSKPQSRLQARSGLIKVGAQQSLSQKLQSRTSELNFKSDDPVFGADGITKDATLMYLEAAAEALNSVEHIDPTSALAVQKCIDYLSSDARLNTREVDSYKLQCCQLERAVRQYQQQIGQLRGENAKNVEIVQIGTQKLKDQAQQIASLEAQLAGSRELQGHYECQLGQASNAAIQRDAEIAEMRAKRDQILRFSNDVTAANTAVRSAYEQAVRELCESRSQCQRLAAQNGQLQDEMLRRDALVALRNRQLDEAQVRKQQQLADLRAQVLRHQKIVGILSSGFAEIGLSVSEESVLQGEAEGYFFQQLAQINADRRELKRYQQNDAGKRESISAQLAIRRQKEQLAESLRRRTQEQCRAPDPPAREGPRPEKATQTPIRVGSRACDPAAGSATPQRARRQAAGKDAEAPAGRPQRAEDAPLRGRLLIQKYFVSLLRCESLRKSNQGQRLRIQQLESEVGRLSWLLDNRGGGGRQRRERRRGNQQGGGQNGAARSLSAELGGYGEELSGEEGPKLPGKGGGYPPDQNGRPASRGAKQHLDGAGQLDSGTEPPNQANGRQRYDKLQCTREDEERRQVLQQLLEVISNDQRSLLNEAACAEDAKAGQCGVDGAKDAKSDYCRGDGAAASQLAQKLQRLDIYRRQLSLALDPNSAKKHQLEGPQTGVFDATSAAPEDQLIVQSSSYAPLADQEQKQRNNYFSKPLPQQRQQQQSTTALQQLNIQVRYQDDGKPITEQANEQPGLEKRGQNANMKAKQDTQLTLSYVDQSAKQPVAQENEKEVQFESFFENKRRVVQRINSNAVIEKPRMKTIYLTPPQQGDDPEYVQSSLPTTAKKERVAPLNMVSPLQVQEIQSQVQNLVNASTTSIRKISTFLANSPDLTFDNISQQIQCILVNNNTVYPKNQQGMYLNPFQNISQFVSYSKCATKGKSKYILNQQRIIQQLTQQQNKAKRNLLIDQILKQNQQKICNNILKTTNSTYCAKEQPFKASNRQEIYSCIQQLSPKTEKGKIRSDYYQSPQLQQMLLDCFYMIEYNNLNSYSAKAQGFIRKHNLRHDNCSKVQNQLIFKKDSSQSVECIAVQYPYENYLSQLNSDASAFVFLNEIGLHIAKMPFEVSIKSLKWVVNLINKLNAEILNQVNSAQQLTDLPALFMQYIEQWFDKTYGLRTLVFNLKYHLVANLIYYRAKNSLVGLFYNIMFGQYGQQELIVYSYLMQKYANAEKLSQQQASEITTSLLPQPDTHDMPHERDEHRCTPADNYSVVHTLLQEYKSALVEWNFHILDAFTQECIPTTTAQDVLTRLLPEIRPEFIAQQLSQYQQLDAEQLFIVYQSFGLREGSLLDSAREKTVQFEQRLIAEKCYSGQLSVTKGFFDKYYSERNKCGSLSYANAFALGAMRQLRHAWDDLE